MGSEHWTARRRRWRFWWIEHVVLPLVAVPLRLWVASWRRELSDESARAAAIATAAPRLVLVTLHGMLAPLLAHVHLANDRDRQLMVMLSPSRDGRLLAALLGVFGIGHVYATTASRGVAGSREFLSRVEAGEIGVVAVDGPRGPRAVVKPGAIALAAMAEAPILVAVASATHAVRFGSWDRPVLPLPFARVRLELRLLPAPREDDVVAATGTVQEIFLRSID